MHFDNTCKGNCTDGCTNVSVCVCVCVCVSGDGGWGGGRRGGCELSRKSLVCARTHMLVHIAM